MEVWKIVFYSILEIFHSIQFWHLPYSIPKFPFHSIPYHALVGGAHLCDIAPADNTAPLEEMLLRWRDVGAVFNLTGPPRFEPQTSRFRDKRGTVQPTDHTIHLKSVNLTFLTETGSFLMSLRVSIFFIFLNTSLHGSSIYYCVIKIKMSIMAGYHIKN